ncbi:MAG TPA: DUF4129 domain-containing protein [Dehalococcoidia bacterium]
MRERWAEAAALAMEALWVYAAAALLAAGALGGEAPSVAAALAAAFGGFGLARLLLHLEAPAGLLRAAWTAATVAGLAVLAGLDYREDLRLWELGRAAALAAHPGETLRLHLDAAVGVAALGLLWVRSGLRARTPLQHGAVVLSFSLGFGVVLAALALAPAFEPAPPVGRAALPFFALGLLALALTQGRRLDLASDVPSRRAWTATVAATLAALLGAALLATLAPALDARGVLLPVAHAVLWLLDLAILVVLIPAIWLTIQILRLVFWLFGGPEREVRPEPPQSPLRDLAQQSDGALWQEVLAQVLQGAAVLAAVVLLVFLVAWAFRRFFRPAERGDGVPETVTGAGSLGEDLRALWRGLAARLRPTEPGAEPVLPPGARRVRALYLAMLRRAAEEGLERPPPATPREFGPALAAHFGSSVPEDVTEAFVAARYGAREPAAGEVEELERRWRGLRARR